MFKTPSWMVKSQKKSEIYEVMLDNSKMKNSNIHYIVSDLAAILYIILYKIRNF